MVRGAVLKDDSSYAMFPWTYSPCSQNLEWGKFMPLRFGDRKGDYVISNVYFLFVPNMAVCVCCLTCPQAQTLRHSYLCIA